MNSRSSPRLRLQPRMADTIWRDQFKNLQGILWPALSDLPTVSSPVCKNISFNPMGKSLLLLRPSRPNKRDVGHRHERWARCGGRFRDRKTNGAKADGEVAWSWRPDAGAKPAEQVLLVTETIKPGLRREREGNR